MYEITNGLLHLVHTVVAKDQTKSKRSSQVAESVTKTFFQIQTTA